MASEEHLTALMSVDLKSADPAVRETAARHIWNRYVAELLDVARNRLAQQIRVKQSEEDIVQDVFQSFFRRVSQPNEFEISDRNHARNLLVRMAVFKARNAAKYWQTQTRDARRECLSISPARDERTAIPLEILKSLQEAGPAAEEVAILSDLLQRLAEQLEEPVRQVLELWWQGYSTSQISAALKTPPTAVYRRKKIIVAHAERIIAEGG